MRKILSDTIMNTTGEEYQIVKNKYGSLKAIEKDVNKAANRLANKPKSGFVDFTDILTANHVLHGLVTGQVGYIAGGVAGAITKQLIKKANNADLLIKKMFNDVDKLTDKKYKLVNPTYEGSNTLTKEDKYGTTSK